MYRADEDPETAAARARFQALGWTRRAAALSVASRLYDRPRDQVAAAVDPATLLWLADLILKIVAECIRRRETIEPPSDQDLRRMRDPKLFRFQFGAALGRLLLEFQVARWAGPELRRRGLTAEQVTIALLDAAILAPASQRAALYEDVDREMARV